MNPPTDPTGSNRPNTPAPRADPARAAEPIDDLVLAGLVRDVAEGWHLPPRRLDEPTWTDRVEPGRVGRRMLGGSLGRLAGAAVVAVGATLALSLLAVWLGQPRADQAGVGASPSGGSATAGASSRPTPTSTDRPKPTALPVLTQPGATPSVTTALVRVGGGHAQVDLATGTLGPQISSATGGGTLVRRSDGSFVCLCIDTDGYVQAAYTHATIVLRTYDAAGKVLDSKALADYTGIPDPRPAAEKDQPYHVDTATLVTTDGRLGFVGWTAREPPTWHSGILVVEMASGRVLDRLALPDVSTGPDDAPVQGLAPRIVLSPARDRLLVTSTAYYFGPSGQDYHEISTHHVATVDGSGLGPPGPFASGVGPLAPFAPAAACPEGQAASGIADDGRAWLSCWTSGGGLQTIRRIGPDGNVLGETGVNAGGEGGTLVAASDGSALWSWAPLTRTLTRIDLKTGQDVSTTAPAPPTSSRDDWLAALGRWIAPSVGAKIFLDPGLVISPDGTRVYALGIDPAPSGAPYGGSSGIFVFDARTLAPIDHWAAVTDYVSIAISADGRWVYAAGEPAVDSTGQAFAPFEASIAVHDAADGSLALLAGRLGSDLVTFSDPVLR